MSFAVRKRCILWVLPLLLGAGNGDLFTDLTDAVGLYFEHDPMAQGSYLLPEIMGSGGAFLDYDNDGDLDIYLIQASTSKLNRLFEQQADGRFRDVTEDSGLGDTGYGMGVAVGDIDNDGLIDVYVTNYGPDVLYHNQGDGQFLDISRKAGISGDGWSSSAAFCDYDRDGYLDLYVVHYVDYAAKLPCYKDDGSPEYCSPQVFPGHADLLYRNNGDRRFADVSSQAGIASIAAPGLGVVCQDLTSDGWPDFYVANDGASNQFWVNERNGSFVDDAFKLGVALNSFGREEAGMGIAAGDVDEDGDLDLFLTHLTDQTNTLYLNDGKLGFRDATAPAGLGLTGLSTTAFGTAFLDYDHDGDLDLIAANGRVIRYPPHPDSRLEARWKSYGEPNLVLRNDLDGSRLRFTDVSEAAGAVASQVEITRGLAVGDLDNDGDVDVLLTNTAGRARLFRNDAEKTGRWLLVRAFDGAHRRDAHGAVVTVVVGGREFVRLANPGRSYLSSHDPRAHFGLPAAGAIEKIMVRWPDGTEESFPGTEPNRRLTLEKGKGSPQPNRRNPLS